MNEDWKKRGGLQLHLKQKQSFSEFGTLADKFYIFDFLVFQGIPSDGGMNEITIFKNRMIMVAHTHFKKHSTMCKAEHSNYTTV